MTAYIEPTPAQIEQYRKDGFVREGNVWVNTNPPHRHTVADGRSRMHHHQAGNEPHEHTDEELFSPEDE